MFPQLQSEADLQKLIDDEIEENLHLDYKAAGGLGKSNEKKKDISQDVSAFANSAGGRIIYGIAEKKGANGQNVPDSITPVTDGSLSKEWLEQVINAYVSPRLQGVRITPVTVTGGMVYVVDIPQSQTAHMSKDFRYYKRFNFQSVAMEDYEVRDAMNRQSLPQLDIRVDVAKRNDGNEMFTIEAINSSTRVAREVYGKVAATAGNCDWLCENKLGVDASTGRRSAVEGLFGPAYKEQIVGFAQVFVTDFHEAGEVEINVMIAADGLETVERRFRFAADGDGRAQPSQLANED